jgi:hypothetical protein
MLARIPNRTAGVDGEKISMATTAYISEKALQRARVIAWMTALGAITPEALAERDELSTTAAVEILDHAVELGLMERHSILVKSRGDDRGQPAE